MGNHISSSINYRHMELRMCSRGRLLPRSRGLRGRLRRYLPPGCDGCENNTGLVRWNTESSISIMNMWHPPIT